MLHFVAAESQLLVYVNGEFAAPPVLSCAAAAVVISFKP